MRSDALVHLCHLRGSGSVADLDAEVGRRVPGGAVMVCGMAPDAACDDVTLRLFQGLPSSAHRARFLPCLSGFEIDDPGLPGYVADRDRQYPGLWRGLGEVFAHKSEPGWTRPVAPDAPAVRLWDVARERRLPVWLHHDLRGNPDAEALDRALRRDATGPPVVLCHAGVPHGGEGDDLAWRLCAQLMRRNPRLSAECSWSARAAAERDPAPLRRLVAAHPDRVMAGSDAVGSAGAASEIAASRRALQLALRGLPAQTLSKVGTENLARLV